MKSNIAPGPADDPEPPDTTDRSSDHAVGRNSAADRKPPADGHDVPETKRKRGSTADRRVARRRQTQAAMDPLTGAYLRSAGIVELQREMERAVRTNSALVVAFVDVESLASVNDSRGHVAGDRLLVAVVQTLAERLRAYDRIVRYGGDEFVCVLPEITESDATMRFAEVNACLSWEPDAGSISFGVARMVAGDSVASLIGKADTERHRKRAR